VMEQLFGCVEMMRLLSDSWSDCVELIGCHCSIVELGIKEGAVNKIIDVWE
jgi:hypothetical protein